MLETPIFVPRFIILAETIIAFQVPGYPRYTGMLTSNLGSAVGCYTRMFPLRFLNGEEEPIFLESGHWHIEEPGTPLTNPPPRIVVGTSTALDQSQ